MKSLSNFPLRLFLTIVFLVSGPLMKAANLPQKHRIHDHGQHRTFVIANDELHLAGKHQPDKILPVPDAEAARRQAEQLSRAIGNEVRLVLYPEGETRTEFTRRILTRDVLVHLEPGTDVYSLAKAQNAKVTRQFDSLPAHYILEAPGAAGAIELAEALRGKPGVISAEPQLARLAQKKSLPNDPLFPQQWHLRNTGQYGGTPKVDVNVSNVWNYFRGNGIYIAIIDDGMEYTHPDLAANSNTSIDYDFNFHDSDPSPDPFNFDYHGTEVAGVAAARGNNGVGICGAAYEATLVGLRLISYLETDADDHDAMLHSNAIIHIKSNSWGAPDCHPSPILAGPGPLMRAALGQGVASGRNGKGVIYVWAGGNGLQCKENINYDHYANAIEVFSVGALDFRGNQAYYSEPGACLVVTAPGGDGNAALTTTDLAGSYGFEPGDYDSTFFGTSASTPLVSGVIALILQANTNLSYRDTKEILLRSSTKVQPSDPDWKTNSAGIAHNHKFGGGLINAEAAVHLATNWAYLGRLTNISLLQTNINLLIPDNNATGLSEMFSFTNSFRVEHVTLALTATDANWGDLAVTLTSPSGMQSRLAEQHYGDPNYSYEGWTFSSVRHWGEEAKGNWTVKVADLAPGVAGHLQALELTVYGTPKAMLTAAETNQSIQLTLEVGAPGWVYAIDKSANMISWTQLTTLTIPPGGKTNYVDTNALLSAGERFYRARLLP